VSQAEATALRAQKEELQRLLDDIEKRLQGKYIERDAVNKLAQPGSAPGKDSM
jgi:hypothetical protein